MAQLPAHGGRYSVISPVATRGVSRADLARRAPERSHRVSPSPAALVLAELFSGLEAARTARDVKRPPLHVVHWDVSPRGSIVAHEDRVKLTDVFAAGVLLHELLVGAPGIDGEEDVQLDRLKSATPRSSSPVGPLGGPDEPALPALAPDPAQRHESPGDTCSEQGKCAFAPEERKSWDRSVFNAREALRRARTVRLAAAPDLGTPVSQESSDSGIDIAFDEPRGSSASGVSPVPRWFSRSFTAAASMVALGTIGLVFAPLTDAPSRPRDPGAAPTVRELGVAPPTMGAPPRIGTPTAMGATGWRSVHVLTRPAGAHASLGGAACITPCTLLVGDADVPHPLTLVRAGFDPFVEHVVVDGDLNVLVALRPGTRAPQARSDVP